MNRTQTAVVAAQNTCHPETYSYIGDLVPIVAAYEHVKNVWWAGPGWFMLLSSSEESLEIWVVIGVKVVPLDKGNQLLQFIYCLDLLRDIPKYFKDNLDITV